MSENCTHNCSTCGESCKSRTAEQTSFLEPLNPASSVKKVIGVVSGKGGVGKSLVTAMMAVKMNSKGKHTAILDADITGPSIPKAFGLNNNMVMMTKDNLMIPATSALGIDIMSANLLLDNDSDPVVWRGPVIAGAVGQFWTDVIWGDKDVLFIDMPPGTGDVMLTVFQTIPVDGVILVSTPQELVEMIVEKALKMAGMMEIPVMALVENMSYVACPDCGKHVELFGKSHVAEIAQRYNIPLTAQLPIDPKLAAGIDKGMIELFNGDWLDKIADAVYELPARADK